MTMDQPTSPVRKTSRKVERLLGYAPAVTATLVVMDDENYVARLWPRDATLWKNDEASKTQITNSLGWLNVAVMIRKKCDDLIAFADEIRSSGQGAGPMGQDIPASRFEDIVLLGMGGSSLCPEVFRNVFGQRAGYPRFHVLDSTVPAAVSAIDNKIDPAKTLFVVASKSGSTIEPQMFFRYFFARVKAVKGDRAGENFIAITDPGTLMERQAKEASFRRIFTGAADIGGRYSALTMFGMVPAALMGIDIKVLLDRALHSVHFCSANTPTLGMPGARRAAVLATFAEAGKGTGPSAVGAPLSRRDKMTLIIEPAFESMALWIEQLVAESTGKEGKGILPIALEPLGEPRSYGDDRFFVYIHSRETNDEKVESLLDALEQAGHPSLRIILNDPLNIGEEFFLWEFATALVGAWLKINPFDQPNVQESKDNTMRLIESFKSTGALPIQEEILSSPPLRFYGSRSAFEGSSASTVLKFHLSTIKPGDYFALTQYFQETPARNKILQNIRRLIRDKFRVATTSGYGPRFLHSTGQLHKGGPNTGVFLQLTADDATDLPIPDEVFTFGILKAAQAIGDFEALLAHGCRALRVHLGADIDAGLATLEKFIEESLAG